MSDDGSGGADAAVASDGARHVVWIDGGRRVMHKSSADAGMTYTSDEPMTQTLASVDEVRVACSASSGLMAVVLEATTVDHKGSQVILVTSDGAEWDPAIRLAEGCSPSVAILDDVIFVGLTEEVDGVDRFSIVSIDPDQDAERLLSIPADDASGRIVADGISVHYALTANVEESDCVVYGCIDVDGKSINEPEVMRSMVETRDVSITMDGDLPVVAWAGDDGRTGVFVATIASKPLYWDVQRIDATAPADVSIAACDGLYVAWTSSIESASEVQGAHVAIDGTVSRTTLSTSGVDAWGPVTFVDGGEVSCMWTEVDRSASEIMVNDDILHASPDIEDLIDMCEDMDDSLFLTKEGRSHLIDRLEGIVALQTDSRDLDANIAISSVVRSLEGDDSVDGYEQYLNKLSKSEDKVAKELAEGLKGNMRDDGSDVTIKSLPDPFNPGTYVPQGYKLFLSFEEAVGQGTSVTVSWDVASDCGIVVQNRVHYGISSVYENTVYGPGTDDPSITITGLSPGQLYKFMPGSKNQVDDWYDGATLECTTTIPPLQVSDIASTVICPHETEVTWSTNYAATSSVNYGLSTSYGSTEFGSSGTSHSVTLSGLQSGTTYHYCVKSVSTSPSGICTSGDLTFTTIAVDDAGSGSDAGGTIATAVGISPGEVSGRLCAHDVSDHYSMTLSAGQTISATLDTSGSDASVRLKSPDGATFATSEDVGGVEHLGTMTDESGQWYLEVHLDSGDGGVYQLCVSLLVGHDAYDLDVGSTGDMSVQGNLPGLSLVDGTGWGDPTASPSRVASVNSSFLLNVPEGSFNVNADHLVTVSYASSPAVPVEVLCNDVWVSVTEMPGTTTRRSHSFVLDHSLISDSDESSDGVNVEMRFGSVVEVFTIGALMLDFASDLSSSSGSMIALDSGWTGSNGVWNGTSGATIAVTIPDVTNGYMLGFNYLNDTDGMGVEQMTSSGYVSIGSIVRHGTGAVVQLDDEYHDADTSTESMDIELRITGPMYNLTSINLLPTTYYNDVGTEDDASEAANTPGLHILDNGEWDASTVIADRTVRRSSTQYADLVLDSPISGTPYIISITYRSSSDVTVRQYVSDTQCIDLATLPSTGTGWDMVSFQTNAAYHDFFEGDRINVLFEVGASDVYIDSMSASVDTDGDGISDHQEALRHVTVANPTVIPLDPFSVDTDSDGVNDDVEFTIGTDPCDADTDDDGLMDGDERYGHTWSTEETVPIPDDDCVYITVDVPAIVGTVTSAILSYGIQHSDQTDLIVRLWDVQANEAICTSWLQFGTPGDPCLFESIDLIDLWCFSPSTFSSATSWTLRVDDVSVGGTGTIQYVRVTVQGETDPLDADSDGDGIPDGEEVDLGADGWETNPMLVDTDGDGVSDHHEVIGSTPCGEPTDPTRRDTDDDGFDDDVDPYMGDMVVGIQFHEYEQLEDINLHDGRSIFFEVKADGHSFSTKRMTDVQTGHTYQLGWRYDVDVDDTNASIDITVSSWADGAGDLGDDIKLDIAEDEDTRDLSFTYQIATGSMTITDQGTDGEEHWWNPLSANSDGRIEMTVSTVVRDRANTILVAGVDDDGVHGLYEVDDGYRYSVDDQLYVIDLNCSDSDSRFVEGMNTILLPRSVAVASYLNDTLMDLGSIGSTDPLHGAGFYATDRSVAGSSHVIATMYKDVTAAQAEGILWMATHDPSGRIGENVTVSSSSLYLMHLPHDVLGAIPTIVENEGMGEMPDYFTSNPFVTVQEFATAVFDVIVGSLTCLWNMATHLVGIGLEFIGDLTTEFASAVHDAVQAIVDAFDAFVDWAVEFIQMTAHSILDPILSTVQGAMDAFYATVKAASGTIEGDIDATGEASSEAISMMAEALFGDMFLLIMGISIAVGIVFLAMKAVTMGAGFIISIALSVVAGIIVQNLIGMSMGTYDPSNPQDGTQGTVTDWIESLFLDAGKDQTAADTVVGYLDSFWCVMELIPAMVLAEAGCLMGAGGLAISILSIVLAFYVIGDHDARLSALTLAIGAIGAVETLIGGGINKLTPELQGLTLAIVGFGLFLVMADLALTVI